MNEKFENAKIVAPWVNYYRELEALFKYDPAIKVKYDEENLEVKLYVEGTDKAEALSKLLPAEKVFGNVTLKVTIIPANVFEGGKVSLFTAAFDGNSAVDEIVTIEMPFSTSDVHFIVFKNEVVQYFNDDIGDLNGLRSTLFEDIANELFDEHDGIYFCTEPGSEELKKPLGEWP